VIDYLGFRLIAITILPINSHTIQYGSYVITNVMMVTMTMTMVMMDGENDI
jgi:hypothetical protein